MSVYIAFEKYVYDLIKNSGTASKEFQGLAKVYGANRLQEIYDKACEKFEGKKEVKVVGRDDF